jgi:glutaredoxin
MELRMYSKTGCPWCERAVEWMNERDIPFDKILLDDDAVRARLYDEMGLTGSERTVPQIVVTFLGDEWVRIGGYQDLITSRVETLFAEGPENSRWG